MDDKKAQIIAEFDKLRQKETADKQVWKARAYAKVIKHLSAYAGEIRTIEDLDGIEGMGEKLRAKAQEILETGALKQAQAYNADESYAVVNELMQVHGIGPSKASELVKTGIKSIADLKGRTDLLNDVQKLGLKYHDDFKQRIPRKEMLKHEAYVKGVVASVDPSLKAEVVGSFRRGAISSGDIDVLITGEDVSDSAALLKQITTKMKADRYIVDTLALGDKKCMAVSRVKYGRVNRRLDLLITHKHEFPFALLYFTGSAEFNTRLRSWVLANKQLSLSEYGLRPPGAPGTKFVRATFETERDIFDYLGLEYIAPRDRTPTVTLCQRA
jgi:DNA polymerase/3'-5' exonuclease PolX